MKLFFSHAAIADHAATRGAGYLPSLMQAAVATTDRGVTFDTEHPAWIALDRQYRAVRGPTKPLPCDEDLTSGYDCGCNGRSKAL
jgi:hypothetical protein